MNSDERKAWVKSLKIGDEVIVRGGGDDRIGRVQSMDETTIIALGIPFNSEGERNFSSIEPSTAALRALIFERHELLGDVSDIDWYEEPTEILRQVLALVRDGK